jgi:hypothetical protein
MRFLRTHPRLRSHSVRLRLCSGAQLISRTGSLLRVKSAVLAVGRPLPVYPQLQTCRCTALRDAKCQSGH